MPRRAKNSASFFATEGVRFTVSGVPDFLFLADDPIRSEMRIEAQKSIRYAAGDGFFSGICD